MNKEQIITFNVYYNIPYAKDTQKHNITMMGTDYWESDDPVAGSKALWEYIYLFMEKGKDALPDKGRKKYSGRATMAIPIKGYKKAMKDLFDFKTTLIDEPNYFWKLFSLMMFPIALIFFIFTGPITILTDIVYVIFDWILPKRGLPSLLREACEAEKLNY